MLSPGVGESWGNGPFPRRRGGKLGNPASCCRPLKVPRDVQTRGRAPAPRVTHLVGVTATAMPATTSNDDDELAPARAVYWDIRDVQFHCRVGRSTAWRMVRESGFPAPIVYSKRCVMWPSAEVIAFLEQRRDPRITALQISLPVDGPPWQTQHSRRVQFGVVPGRRL